MKPIKRYILMFLILFMTFSEGLGWNAPLLENFTTCLDKGNHIDKVQELNSLTARTNKDSKKKSIEVKVLKNNSYSYSFSNLIFNSFDVFKPVNLLKACRVKTYLHLFQLY